MRKRDILGMAIGDGHLRVRKGHSASLSVGHSIKQVEYLMYKYQYCCELYPNKNFTPYIIDMNPYTGVRFEISDSKLFRIWHSWLYKNNTKTFTKKVLEKLTPEAIAFWYCDDGSMYYKKRNGKIHAVECVISTCCTKNEAEIVRDYFDARWNIKMTIKKDSGHYSLRFGTNSARQFVQHFGQHVPECMSYKIDKV